MMRSYLLPAVCLVIGLAVGLSVQGRKQEDSAATSLTETTPSTAPKADATSDLPATPSKEPADEQPKEPIEEPDGVVAKTRAKTPEEISETDPTQIFHKLRVESMKLKGKSRLIYKNLVPCLEKWSTNKRFKGDHREARLMERMFYTWSYRDEASTDAWALVIETVSGDSLTPNERYDLRSVLDSYSQIVSEEAKTIDEENGIDAETPFVGDKFDKAMAARHEVYKEFYNDFIDDMRAHLRPHQYDALASVLALADLPH